MTCLLRKSLLSSSSIAKYQTRWSTYPNNKGMKFQHYYAHITRKQRLLQSWAYTNQPLRGSWSVTVTWAQVCIIHHLPSVRQRIDGEVARVILRDRPQNPYSRLHGNLLLASSIARSKWSAIAGSTTFGCVLTKRFTNGYGKIKDVAGMCICIYGIGVRNTGSEVLSITAVGIFQTR